MLKSELIQRVIVLNPQLPKPVCRDVGEYVLQCHH
jgi:hypothetical protein